MHYNILDFFIALLIVGFAIVGYQKGFTSRFLSFIGTVCALIGAFLFYQPFLVLLSIKLGAISSMPIGVFSKVYPSVFGVFSFILLFIILQCIKWIILFLCKPICNRIIGFFTLTSMLDGILGSFLSILKTLFVVYFVLILMYLPVNKTINHMVENSTLAHYILDIVPDMTKELKEMSHINSIVSSAKSIKDKDGKLNLNHLQTTYQLIKNSYQLGILTQEDIERYFNAVIEEINESDFTIEIPKKHQSDLDKLLEMPGISSKVKDSILQHVKVV